ncbi:MAG: hypothetical protein KDA41_01250 [Planctomycetales bacterium]|nr:hypothetical protein [Planctomycetales bacterium]
MMPQLRCSRCRFWQRTHVHSEVGRCRRYPPEPSDIEAVEGSPPRLVVLHDWPTTLANDRCGEFVSSVLPFARPAPASGN